MELLRDRRAAFEEAGVQPVGISRDSPWCHIAWRQALDLNFGLLSDFNGDAVRGFGIGHCEQSLHSRQAAECRSGCGGRQFADSFYEEHGCQC